MYSYYASLPCCASAMLCHLTLLASRTPALPLFSSPAVSPPHLPRFTLLSPPCQSSPPPHSPVTTWRLPSLPHPPVTPLSLCRCTPPTTAPALLWTPWRASRTHSGRASTRTGRTSSTGSSKHSRQCGRAFLGCTSGTTAASASSTPCSPRES